MAPEGNLKKRTLITSQMVISGNAKITLDILLSGFYISALIAHVLNGWHLESVVNLIF